MLKRDDPMKILILSPHTDDAELGAGGSISKLIGEGNQILWVVFSIGKKSLPRDSPTDTLKREFLRVVKYLDLKEEDYKILDFEVRNFYEHRQEILEELIKIKGDFKPQLVIGPSIHDFHQDHQVVANEMIRAFKITSSIISYELPWNHVSFNTQLFMRLEHRHIMKKWEMLKNYRSQIQKGRVYFTKEFIYGLANVRGVQCNSKYAEAFEVVRWMI